LEKEFASQNRKIFPHPSTRNFFKISVRGKFFGFGARPAPHQFAHKNFFQPQFQTEGVSVEKLWFFLPVLFGIGAGVFSFKKERKIFQILEFSQKTAEAAAGTE